MSEIKVNKISPRAACGTVQLGDSGDTFTIPAGATINNQGTATNFGATGSASWVTTVKTSTFTATAGEGYFCNTTAGAFTVNLPAGSAGAVVAIKDYANTFDSNAVTVSPNGSDKIGSVAGDATLSTEGIAVTFVFVDSTQGWLVTDSGLQSELPTAEYVTASGGTITTSGDFKVHTFTGPGTFTVSSTGNACGSSTVEYLVVAGGGGGGAHVGGGGGAGGFRNNFPSPVSGGLSVTAQGYPITVGGGGPGGVCGSCGSKGATGSNSIFSTITSAGGGGGGANASPGVGLAGGSGGGGGHGAASPPSNRFGGAGNTPPVSPPQGNAGGQGTHAAPGYSGGGGGGAAAIGADGGTSPTAGGNGGAGTQLNIDGNNYYWSGGGGGGTASTTASTPVVSGNGGIGGGGGSGAPDGPNTGPTGTGGGSAINSGANGAGKNGGNGGANSGGGAGSGSEGAGGGGVGGSGIVIIRYKFQN